MRRGACLILALYLCGIFSGCITGVQLKDRAIIQAVGVDFHNEKYLLTMQYFVPTQEGGGDSQATQNRLITASGATLSEAVETASRNHGRQIFFGSNKVIVIGHGAAVNDLYHPIEYFNTNHQLHPGMYVLLAEGNAADLIGDENTDASQIEKLSETARRLHRIHGGTMLDTVIGLDAGRSAVDLPILHRDENGFCIEGAGLINGHHLIDELTPFEVEGSLWLSGNIGRSLLQIDLPDSRVCSLEILSGCTRITPRSDNGRLIFNVDIQADCVIRELSGEGTGGQELSEEICQLAQQKIFHLCRLAIRKTVIKHGADLFELREILKQRCPEIAVQHRENMPGLLQNAQFQINVSFHPSRIGLDAIENAG